MAKTKLVIFDLDGTLVHAYVAVAESFNYALNKLGYESKSYGLIKRSVGRGDRSLLAKFVDKKDHNKALKYFREHHKEALARGVRTLPGARVVLKQLKSQGCFLSVASNRPTQFSKIILDALGWDKVFDFVLCGDRSKRPKPYPDILNETLDHFGLKASEALFVGDMDVDIQTGKAAKIKTVAITTGSSRLNELENLKPFKVISKLTELPVIIN